MVSRGSPCGDDCWKRHATCPAAITRLMSWVSLIRVFLVKAKKNCLMQGKKEEVCSDLAFSENEGHVVSVIHIKKNPQSG